MLNAVSSEYAVAPIFLIRIAGVPFDLLDKLATPKTVAAARNAIAAEHELSQIIPELKKIASSPATGSNRKEQRALEGAIRSRSAERMAQIPAFKRWRDRLLATLEPARAVGHALSEELTASREHLREIARTILPRYLVFGDPAMRERLIKQSSGPLPARNKEARAHERHLLLYVQRICAKNDSLSEFGPEGWGTIDEAVRGIQIDPRPGIAAR
ncbi:MAG TPA: hypothetical protein VFP82_06485, partial [Chthoniobacterales bacterium]|nr:hypothetical protein [Chthoniobacterales bacterium]